MPMLMKFTLATTIGCFPFVAVLAWLGVKVGANWEQLLRQLKWLDYVVAAALALLVVWLIWRLMKQRRA
jgi:membrane protein DedA with SNARE-associated domain